MRLIDTIRIVHVVFLITAVSAAVTVYHVSLIYVFLSVDSEPCGLSFKNTALHKKVDKI